MSSVVFGRKSGTGTFHRFAKSGAAVCMIACALGAPARAASKVAVIANTDGPATGWCVFLSNNGYDCTSFPASGPTEPLDPFQVIIDLSDVWTDPTGTLADQMRARKGVITWERAPFALGIDANPVVQAWIGARDGALADSALITTATDPILGPIPPGTEITNCGASICTALIGEYPTAKVLARWYDGTGPIGILRNTWEGGQSVYFPTYFRPSSPLHQEIILRTMAVLSRPIPASSTWGLVCAGLLLSVCGTLILRNRQGVQRVRLRTLQSRLGVGVLVVVVLGFHERALGLQGEDQIIVQASGKRHNFSSTTSKARRFTSPSDRLSTPVLWRSQTQPSFSPSGRSRNPMGPQFRFMR